jgi:hypothetical protein
MTRPRPRLSLGTKRANRNSLLRPQAHRRSASEASLARHSPFTHPSLALHSETKKMVDMDQCTFGARPLRGGHERRGSGDPKIIGQPTEGPRFVSRLNLQWAYGRPWTGFALIAAASPAERTRRLPSSFQHPRRLRVGRDANGRPDGSPSNSRSASGSRTASAKRRSQGGLRIARRSHRFHFLFAPAAGTLRSRLA